MSDQAQLSLFGSSSSKSEPTERTEPRSSEPPTSSGARFETEAINATARPHRPAKAKSPRDGASTAESRSSGAGSTAESEQLRLLSTNITRSAPDPYLAIPRPTKRSECLNEARPCPWVGCKHHLMLEVATSDRQYRNRATSLRLNSAATNQSGGRRPGLLASSPASIVRTWIDDAMELLEAMPYTCALDVIDDHPDGLGPTGVGRMLNATKQAIQEKERKPHVRDAVEQLREFLEDATR